MTTLSSEKTTIQRPAAALYSFLSDFNNYEKLMPEQVKDWTSTSDECSFTISGMASLGMKITERTPMTSIKAIRHGNAPFDFVLTCTIEDHGASSVVQLTFEANLNPMLRMMAERPLTNFLNLLVQRLNALEV